MTSQFVSSKVPVLNAPGIKRNELYYDVDSTRIQEVTVDGVTGRFSQSLSSLAFGSTSQITIPSANFLSNTYLFVELPPLLANQSLASGWLYALIKSINYQWSGANISSLQLSGESVRQIAILESSRRKAEAMVTTIGGEAIADGPSTKPIYGTIVLPMPWSSSDYTAEGQKKPYDTSLLSGPITISIEMHPASRIYANTGVMPTAMLRGTVFTREYVLEDRGNSIRQDLMKNPDLVYTYPFIHRQSPAVIQNITSGITNTVNLSQFLNSDLLGISFAVKYKKDQFGTATVPAQPNASLQLSDVELDYNGQSIYKAPGLSAQLINMLYSDTELGVISDALIRNATPWTSDQIQSYVYLIPFGSNKNVSFHSKYDNTSRYPSEQMSLTFTPHNHLPADVTAYECICELTYYFSAAGSVQSGVMTIQLS